MAAELEKSYMVGGSSIRFEGQILREVVETFHVKGIVATSMADFALRAATVTGLPKLWDEHPDTLKRTWENVLYGQTLRLANKEVIPRSATNADVKCTYLNVGPFIDLRGGSRFESVVTDLAFKPTLADDNLYPLVVADAYQSSLGSTMQYNYQAALMPRDIPLAVIALSRVTLNPQRLGQISVAGSASTKHPIELQLTYHGHINSNAVTLGGQSFPAGTLRCENVSYDSVGWGDLAFNVQIELAYNPMTWHIDVAYTDLATGAPKVKTGQSFNLMFGTGATDDPTSASTAGRKRVRRYPAENFDALVGVSTK